MAAELTPERLVLDKTFTLLYRLGTQELVVDILHREILKTYLNLSLTVMFTGVRGEDLNWI